MPSETRDNRPTDCECGHYHPASTCGRRGCHPVPGGPGPEMAWIVHGFLVDVVQEPVKPGQWGTMTLVFKDGTKLGVHGDGSFGVDEDDPPDYNPAAITSDRGRRPDGSPRGRR